MEDKQIEELARDLCDICRSKFDDECSKDLCVNVQLHAKEICDRGWQRPKHGTWQRRYRYSAIWHFRCSECQMTSARSQKEHPTYRICPHCGAQMEIGGE